MEETLKRKIILADDDDDLRDDYGQYLKNFGYDVEMATNAQEVLDLVFSSPNAYGLLILDVFMPRDYDDDNNNQKQGIWVAETLERRGINVSIKFITEHRDKVRPDEFRRFKNYKDYYYKPIHPDDLLNNVRDVIGQ